MGVPQIPSHDFVMRAAVEVHALMMQLNWTEETGDRFAGEEFRATEGVFKLLLRNLCHGDKELTAVAYDRIINDVPISDAIEYAWQDMITEAQAANEDFDWNTKTRAVHDADGIA